MSRSLALVLSALSLLAPAAAQEPAATPEFESLAVDAGAPVIDALLADLDGDGRKDVLFTVDPSAPAWIVRLQASDGRGFGPPQRISIPPGCAALSVADLLPAPGIELVLLSAHGLDVINVSAAATPQPYAQTELVFPPEYRGAPRFWAWGRDQDGDGIDDLLVPGLEADLLVRGTRDGAPAGPPLSVRTPSETRLRNDPAGLLALRRRRPRTALHRVVADEAPLPVYLDGQGLRWIPRSEDGGFGGAPRTLFAATGGGEGALGLLQRTSVTLEDIDGNHLTDLILARTKAEGGQLPELRTELLFFLNHGRPATTPSHAIRLPGVLSSGPDLVDLDGDGRKDLLVSVFGASVKSEIQRLIGKVKLTWYAYRSTGADPPFGRSPDLTVEDSLPTATFEAWALRHRLLFGEDWSGDGRPDLIRVQGDDHGLTLALHPGAPKDKPLAFADKALSTLRHDGPCTGYRLRSLAAGRPAVMLDLPAGVVFVVLRTH